MSILSLPCIYRLHGQYSTVFGRLLLTRYAKMLRMQYVRMHKGGIRILTSPVFLEISGV